MSKSNGASFKSVTHRAQLLEVMCKYPDLDIAALAQQLGFLHVMDQVQQTRGEIQVLKNQIHSPDSIFTDTKIKVESQAAEALWMPTYFETVSTPKVSNQTELAVTTANTIWRKQPTGKVVHRTMMSWPGTRRLLDPVISSRRSSNRPDIDRIIQKLAKNQLISRIPSLQRSCFPAQLTVIEDTSVRNIPYREDYRTLIRRIIEMAPKDRVVWLKGDAPRRWRCQSSGSEERHRPPREELMPGSTILVLGDFGRLDQKSGLASRLENSWREWCRTMRLQNCELVALVPFSADYLSPSIRRLVNAVGWVEKGVEVVRDPNRREALVRQLFALAYPATCVEPSLLRELRLMVNGASDPSIESDFWQHSWLDGRMPSGAKNDQVQIKAELLKQFESLHRDTQERVLRLIRNRRGADNAVDLWLCEFANLPVSMQRLIDEYRSDQEDAENLIRELAGCFEKQEIDPGMSDLFHWQTWGASQALLTNRKVGPLVTKYRKRFFPTIPVHHELQSTGQGEYKVVTPVAVRAEGNKVEIHRLTPDSIKGSDWGVLRSCDGKLEFKAVLNKEQKFWKSGKKPDWVSAFGSDEYGLWCEFQVPRHDENGVVTQRMRWIKPGTFMMGSPETTSDLWIRDETRHEVTLTQGFWIAVTPCTQELWLSIDRGKNPSQFTRELHPVDSVSWEDSQAWIEKLQHYYPMMNPTLPSEAQWEYACRAGTTSAYCFDDTIFKLGDYAWYGSNSGNGTHDVGQKEPNAWGVSDMHGNIWEWCLDWCGRFSSESVTDPVGLENGLLKVIRGGGWNSPARDLRSSCRFISAPNDKLNFIGFRLLISSQGAEPNEPASTIQVRVKDSEPVDDLREVSFWKSGKKPDWVSAFGKDRYGLWYEFQLPNYRSNKEVKSKDRIKLEPQGFVTQRMRWIKPGTFMMGSHASTKKQWWGYETQHEVTLTRGFWIADTPCTQGLWMGVGVSKNPSRFQGFNNPVEQVSWEDCEAWLQRLGDIHPQMQAALPSEAQWEYACRAGSTGAYCFGDSEEELEEYAWYQKNSGNTTHPVGRKLPNAWGLFDLHGNVWEWCEDDYREYTRKRAIDPVSPSKGTDRVIRGGGWDSPARRLRSACRFRFDPGRRVYYLGFRLLSSAQDSEPSEGAMVPEAESGTERARIGSGELEYGFLQSIDLDAVGETTPEDQFSEIAVNTYTSIRVVSDQEGYQFDRLEKPDWAVDFGHDEYGLYSVFEVEPSKKGTPIRQKMRWIPPGRFLMGSPEGNDYSLGNEYPQHEVVITHGYWMFDTPCTQALWTALKGKNPSYFEDPARPVEQVSWEDAFGFAEKLNQWFAERNSKMRGKKVLGWDELVFRLPTESEWEYACRAGTTGDTYGGDLKIEGDAKALLLDRIGWYGGNSGHNYDLKTSLALERDWLKDRQYPYKEGGTRKVATKTPSPWGLYDMLGNVWEWCEDWYGQYTADRATDPIGPSTGSYRVMRGGSWGLPARYLRSACRNGGVPGSRSDDLGFRLLSSARQAKPTESEEGASRSEQREEAEGRGRDSST